MIFEHTEERSLLRDMVRDFAESEILPLAKERGEYERFHRPLMFDRPADLGLSAVVFSEEYSGAGRDYTSHAIDVEELSRVCGSTCVTLSAHLSLQSNPIILFGSEHQKKTIFLPLATGKEIGAFGLRETFAVRDGKSR